MHHLTCLLAYLYLVHLSVYAVDLAWSPNIVATLGVDPLEMSGRIAGLISNREYLLKMAEEGRTEEWGQWEDNQWWWKLHQFGSCLAGETSNARVWSYKENALAMRNLWWSWVNGCIMLVVGWMLNFKGWGAISERPCPLILTLSNRLSFFVWESSTVINLDLE